MCTWWRGRNLKGWAEKSGKDTCRIDNLCFSCVFARSLGWCSAKALLASPVDNKDAASTAESISSVELLIVFSLQSGMIFRSRNSNVHLHICKGRDKRNKSYLKCKLLSTLESFRRSFLGPAFEIAARKPTTTLKL